MKDYEFTVILQPDVDEETRNQLIERIVSLMKGGNEEVPDPTITHWGEKKLAYPIKKYNLGYYIFIEGKMEAQQIRELERNMFFIEQVLRHMVIRHEELNKFQFDYKDASIFRDYTTEHGQIIPRRRNRLSAKQQRSLAKAIKRARHIALIPFVRD
jgi:small subunit ribosomal protein S6